eukprot:COSAG01_NODE_10057_length_2260_cov_41.094401_1_plen_223_part_00
MERRYSDKDYERALRGIMCSHSYQHRCCGIECKINAECEKCGRKNERESEDRIDDQLFDMYHIGKIHEQNKYNKRIADAKRKAGLSRQLLLTIVFDQKLSPLEAIKKQHAVVELIRNTDYIWMRDREVLVSYEYFTQDGQTFKPHLHFAFEKTVAPSVVQRKLYDKLVKGKQFGVYGVNCVMRPNNVASDYVKGEKQQAKQCGLAEDDLFRDKYHLKKYYKF